MTTILILIAVVVFLAGIVVVEAILLNEGVNLCAEYKQRLESSAAAYEELDTEANALRKEVANLKACRKDLDNSWDRLDD